MSNKVSVIIPVYNTQEFLKICLKTVLHQEDVDMEVICVDDKSTDSSPDILRRFAEKDDRIKIISHKKNLGLPSARNTGMEAAKGDYLIHLDSDDFWYTSKCLSTLIQIAEIDNCDVLRFNGEFFTGEGKSKNLVPGSESVNIRLEESEKLWAFRAVYLYLWRADFIRDHNLRFNPDITIGEDGMFVSAALTKTSKISITKGNFYRYRVNEASIMRKTWSFDQFIEELRGNEIIEKNIAHLPEVLLSHRKNRAIMYVPLRLLRSAAKDLPQIERMHYLCEIRNYIDTTIAYHLQENPGQRLGPLLLMKYLVKLPAPLVFSLAPFVPYLIIGGQRFHPGKKTAAYNKRFHKIEAVKRRGVQFFHGWKSRLTRTRKKHFTNREGNTEWNFTLDNNKKPVGTSIMLRVKNEELNIQDCLTSILPVADEIVIIDNNSQDQTLKIVEQFKAENQSKVDISIYSYPFNIARCGAEHRDTDANSLHSLVYYYNWCLSKCRFSNILKWDADMRLINEENNIHRFKRFLTTFAKPNRVRAGETRSRAAYYHPEKGYWRSKNQYFSEIRLFSNSPKVFFVKDKYWEKIDLGKVQELVHFRKPISYEVKHVNEDEFSHWTSLNFAGDRKSIEYRTIQRIRAGYIREDDQGFDITPDLLQ